jgi:hypothetical protein
MNVYNVYPYKEFLFLVYQPLYLNSRIHIRDAKLVLDGKLVCENPSEYEFRDG